MAKPLRILANLEGEAPPGDYTRGDIIQIGALPGGMQSGRASVAFVAELGDGTYVFAETSLRNFMTAAVTLAAAYPDECREHLQAIDRALAPVDGPRSRPSD